MKNISFLNHLKLNGKENCARMQERKLEIQNEDLSLMDEQAKQIQNENVESNLLKLNFKLIDIDTAFGN